MTLPQANTPGTGRDEQQRLVTRARIARLRARLREFHDERLMELKDAAAGLAFYAALSLVPFLLLAVLLVGVVLDRQSPDAVGRLLAGVAPADASQLVLQAMRRVASSGLRGGIVPFLIAVGAAVWAVSKVTGALVRSLNRVFHVSEDRPLIYRKALTLGVTAAAGALVAGVALLQVAVPLLASRIQTPVLETLSWTRFPLGVGLMTLVWTALYRLLPSRPPRLECLGVGAAVGVVAWLLATWAFSVWLDQSLDLEAVYGVSGGVLVLLLWLWISAFCLLGGAEVGRALAERRRSQLGSGGTLAATHDGTREVAP